MKSSVLWLFAAVCVLPAEDAPNTKPAEPAPTGHDHATHDHATHDQAASFGLKKELVAGITEKDFLKLGDQEKTVKITIVAVWSDHNYGMNFNGYSKGGAVYAIPKNWTVEVTYINPSPIPHSLIVIEKEDLKKIQVAEPYFTGAAVPKHLQGLSYGKNTFSFVANEEGEYAFACGFPTHALGGHWIALNVAGENTVPTLQLGTNPVVEATK